ncbi:MAG: ABC transporter ATP-binding protein/permease [Butyrivibrio sp.]|nr:ABC transporter ATP-binding protein/permease [Acetatifactor muris]MCM1559060.1 ABC transporter ATP-binding protein/permease [Butyrivibrio sp.]
MAEERKPDVNNGSGGHGPGGHGPGGHGPGGPGRGPRGPRPKLENPGKLLKRVLGYTFKDYGIQWVIVIVCIFASVFASLQGTLFMRTLIDDYIVPLMKQQNPDFGELAQAIGRVACFYGLGVLASFTQSRLMIYITQGTQRNLRNDLFEKMEKLPIKYFDTHAHGDIMSIYTNDIDTMRQLISQSIPQLVNSLITVIGTLVSMLVLDIPLTLVTLLMVVVMMVAAKKIGSRSSSYFLAQQRNLGSLNGCIEETMTGQKVVKVFCHEQESLDRFNELNDRLCESAYSANKFANIMGPVNAQLGNLSYVVCSVAGGVLAITGVSGLTLGSLASFLNLNKSFSMPINQISMQFNSIIMALAGADRIFKLMDETPETDQGYVELVNAVRNDRGELTESSERTGLWAWKHYHKDSDTTTYQQLEGDVVFDRVDFGYNDEKMILHDIELFAKPGQKIAFVGATGAGKTTITNLINRFYSIQDGKIRYDGINVNKIKLDDLRRSLGIVLQDTHLFTGTVMENIRYGKLDATDEEVVKAAKLANADGFIRRLPEGYNTMLHGDGANLSQGQRQLLAIARAAIADPPVLILDEATSSIDTRTEKLVQQGMDALMKGRTNFVIAHRLSTVRNSDCIIVLEQGRIIERGTHDQLIEQKGKYYQLYTGKSV